MKELSGKVAVVTGASRGIGFALCEQFADAGMNLVLADIDAAGLADAEKGLQSRGRETLAVVMDVAGKKIYVAWRNAPSNVLARRTCYATTSVCSAGRLTHGNKTRRTGTRC